MNLFKHLKQEHKYFMIDSDIDNIINEYQNVKKLKEGESIQIHENYIHDLGEYMLYIGDRNVLIPQQKNMKLIFKKNKLYPIPNRNRVQNTLICYDEFKSEFNIMDVCWDIFYFVSKDDVIRIKRKFKLDKINEIG